MASEVSIEGLQQDLLVERYRGRLQGENTNLYSEIERLRLRLALLRQGAIAPGMPWRMRNSTDTQKGDAHGD